MNLHILHSDILEIIELYNKKNYTLRIRVCYEE